MALPERSESDVKVALTCMARQAAEKAATGPKIHEEALHKSINEELDRLQARGALGGGR